MQVPAQKGPRPYTRVGKSGSQQTGGRTRPVRPPNPSGSGRGAFASRREPAIEALALAGHFDEQLRGLEAGAVFLLEPLAELDEFLDAHHVDPRQRPARIRCKAEAQNGADVGLAYVGQHALLEAARRLQ